MKVSRSQFEAYVAEAVDLLPDGFREYMDNVSFVVEAAPTQEQLEKQGVPPGHTLFGLYEGVPRSERGNYGFAAPDQITIFHQPIQRACTSKDELKAQIRHTVWHEIAHHFGMDEERVRRMEQQDGFMEPGEDEGKQ